MDEFENEVEARLARAAKDADLNAASSQFMNASIDAMYSYNFRWLGVPIIQYPQDIVALQEIVWSARPDIIVETGIARGGSLSLSASLLALLDLTEARAADAPPRRVIGVDIDIRDHTRRAIGSHPLADRITMIEGPSTDAATVARVTAEVGANRRVLVCLDSNHTHAHVLAELNAYAPLVGVGSYCIVYDTVIENLPDDSYPDRPWDKGDNPMTAVRDWLAANPDFEVDRQIDAKLKVSVAPNGYLRRTR